RIAGDQVLHDEDLIQACPIGQRTAQCGGLHLLGGPLRVVARNRSVDDSAAVVLGSADRTLTGVAGYLLTVRPASAGADLRLGRALTGSGKLCHDDLVDQRHVGGHAEDLGGQINGAGLGTSGVEDVDCLDISHVVQASFTAERTRTTPPLGPGTAPLMSRKLFSLSTAWIVRFWVVCLTAPIRPAMRIPLNTRPGVAAPPIEPGLR